VLELQLTVSYQIIFEVEFSYTKNVTANTGIYGP
jgi:hypothetical protein